jgi:hypothetical protein
VNQENGVLFILPLSCQPNLILILDEAAKGGIEMLRSPPRICLYTELSATWQEYLVSKGKN